MSNKQQPEQPEHADGYDTDVPETAEPDYTAEQVDETEGGDDA